MKLLLSIFLMLNLTFAEELLQTQERSLFEPSNVIENSIDESKQLEDELYNQIEEEQTQNKQVEEEHKQSAIYFEEQDYSYLFTEASFDSLNKQSNSIYAKFVNYPTTIYTSQRFAIEIESIITTQEFTKIESRFIDAKDVSIINPQQIWQKMAKNSYKNLYFFKVHTENFQMPTIQIVLYNNDEIVDVSYLKPKELSYTDIAVEDMLFSNVIASSVELISSKTRQYSNSELLAVLEIEAVNGNLEDFRLKEFKKQLLMSLEEEYPKQKLIYNTIVPIHTKEINFNYFDTKTNRFKKISVPIKLEEELVSTQTDLNPNDNNIELYKKIALGILTIFFILLYLLKRKNSYIVIAIVLSILFFIFAKPNGAMIIEQDTKIYILPTKNSTVFYITANKQMVEILDKKRPFIKILFQLNGQNIKTVGWIKEKDIVED